MSKERTLPKASKALETIRIGFEPFEIEAIDRALEYREVVPGVTPWFSEAHRLRLRARVVHFMVTEAAYALCAYLKTKQTDQGASGLDPKSIRNIRFDFVPEAINRSCRVKKAVEEGREHDYGGHLLESSLIKPFALALSMMTKEQKKAFRKRLNEKPPKATPGAGKEVAAS